MPRPPSPHCQDLATRDVDLWYVRVADALADGWLEVFPAVLSAAERVRRDRFVFEQDRRLFHLSRILLRTTLARYLDEPAADLEFASGEHGKPDLVPRQNPHGLRFNLSHSAGLAICGVSFGRDIGVDCEPIDRQVGLLSIARRNFSPAEAAAVESASAADQPAVFFEIWTLKEAYIKACGTGLSRSLRGFSFVRSPDRDVQIEFHEGCRDSPSAWQFSQPEVDPDYKVAVAVRGGNDERLSIAIRDAVQEPYER